MGVAALWLRKMAQEAAPPPELIHNPTASTPIPGPSPIEGEGRACKP